MKNLILIPLMSTILVSCVPKASNMEAAKAYQVSPSTLKVVSQSIDVKQTTFEIEMKLNQEAICIIEYGLTQEFGEWVQTSSIYSTDHLLAISGLQPNTLYYYRVSFMGDDSYNPIISDKTFKTLSME